MGDTVARAWTSLTSGSNTDRVVFFSDAVFAIALTLLVVELQPPEVDFGDGAALLEALAEQSTKYVGFVVSFMVIAINWVLHHEKFQVIVRWDTALVRANFLLLLVVAFLPFPTAVFSDQPLTPIAITLYTGVVAALSLAQGLVWIVAWRRGLVRHDVPRSVFRAVLLRGLPVVAAFVIAAILPWFVDPWWAIAALFLAMPFGILSRVVLRDAPLDRRYPDEEPDEAAAVDSGIADAPPTPTPTPTTVEDGPDRGPAPSAPPAR